jgi:hypothetical protein
MNSAGLSMTHWGLSAATANELTVAQVGLRVLNIVLILFVRLGKKRFL